MTKSPPQWVYAQEPDDDDGGMAEALLEKVARAIRDLLDAHLKRTEQLHDLLSEARETVRKRLEPSSPQEDRDLYEKLNTSLYSLRGDPFDMHIRAALSVIENEMMLASASASPSLGKDQVQSEASRHVVPPECGRVPSGPGSRPADEALRSSPPSAASIPSRGE